MKKILFLFIVFLTVIVTGIFFWFSAHHNPKNDVTIPLVVAVLFGVTLSILTELQRATTKPSCVTSILEAIGSPAAQMGDRCFHVRTPNK